MTDTLHPMNCQVRLVFECMKTKIARDIISKCATIPVIRYVAFDKVKLLAADFLPNEIPAIQLIDVNMTSVHEAARAKKTWRIALEILMRGDQSGAVSQNDLWNLENEVLRKLWADPGLSSVNQGGSGGKVIQMNFVGSQTDLHLLEPYYFSRLDFDVLFYEDLVRSC